MEIKLFDNLKNALKDNRDELAQEEDLYGDSYYGDEESAFDDLRALCLLDKDGSDKRIDIRMPTLEEYVNICKKYEKIAVLELKEAMTEEAVGKIVDRVEALGYLDKMIFISFDFNNLVYVRRKKHAQAVQYLIGKTTFTEDAVQRVKEYRFDIDIYYKHLTEELIREWHEAGIAINCWTVDDPADAEQLAAWGVDYITTNILE